MENEQNNSGWLEELAQIKRKPSTNAGRIIVNYGPTGWGKTTMWCQAPDSILVECNDESSEPLKRAGNMNEDYPVRTTSSFDGAVSFLRGLAENKDHGFKWVIIDGGSGLKRWVDEMVVANECEGERGRFASFGFGDKSAAFYWMELMDALKALRAAGIWAVLICHDGVANKKNPKGNDYPKNSPDLGKDRVALTLKEADEVLYSDFVVAETNVDKKLGKAKAVGGTTRVLYCNPNAAYEAKNRFNFPDEMIMGSSAGESFQIFRDAVKASKKK